MQRRESASESGDFDSGVPGPACSCHRVPTGLPQNWGSPGLRSHARVDLRSACSPEPPCPASNIQLETVSALFFSIPRPSLPTPLHPSMRFFMSFLVNWQRLPKESLITGYKSRLAEVLNPVFSAIFLICIYVASFLCC